MPTVLDSLNSALHQAFSDNKTVFLLGEDVLDPYGGAFKVTRGLSTQFPHRVLTTPISEAGFVGVATGMALRGLRPVVEIMFGDFISLIADQIINHLTKFRWMYNDQVSVPLVIRSPMGGRRGYGPTHSQTLEKLFLGIPCLKVIAPAALSAPDGSKGPGELLYQAIITDDEPLLFIENKLQYILPIQSQADLDEFILAMDVPYQDSGYPTYTLTMRGTPPASLTIAAYGYMAELARQAVVRLAYEHEIFAELVVPTQLSPFKINPIIDSSSHTGALLVVEEGTHTLGWGAEVLARVVEASGSHPLRCKRLAANEVPIPAARSLEEQVLPDVDQIIQSAINLRQPLSYAQE
jgi:pyruvate/2-oxoglutarate/acetoin dehydrogenase E1 component